MVDDLDAQLAEYQDIKAWLAGQKPPAQGRTWRRRMQVQIQKALPPSVRGATFALAPHAGTVLVRMAFMLAVANTAPVLADILLPPGLAPAGGSGSLLDLTEDLRWMMEVGRSMLTYVGGVGMLLAAVSWVIAGE